MFYLVMGSKDNWTEKQLKTTLTWKTISCITPTHSISPSLSSFFKGIFFFFFDRWKNQDWWMPDDYFLFCFSVCPSPIELLFIPNNVLFLVVKSIIENLSEVNSFFCCSVNSQTLLFDYKSYWFSFSRFRGLYRKVNPSEDSSLMNENVFSPRDL